MRTQWITALLLGSALVVGCGDRGSNPSARGDENTTSAPAASPADAAQDRREAVSPDDTRVAPRADSAGARATTGSRNESGSRAPATSSRPANAASNDLAGRRIDRNDDTTPRANPNANARSSASTAPRAEYREVKLPSGTSLPLELMTALSSKTAAVETPVRARLRQSIAIDGVTAIPAGSIFTGHVTEVDDAGRVRGRAHLSFAFTEAEIGGAREDLRTNPLTFEAEATKGEDATKIGAGAGIGAVIGGIVGGGKGAAKGAAIGGAAGTGAVLATKGKEVNLAAGTDLAATLADSFTVRVRER